MHDSDDISDDDLGLKFAQPDEGFVRMNAGKPCPFKHREADGYITAIDVGPSPLPGYVSVHFVSDNEFRMELDIHHEEAPAFLVAEERLGALEGMSSGVNIRTMAGLSVNDGKRATRVGSVLLGVNGPLGRLEIFAPPILSGPNEDEVPRLMATNMMYGDMRKVVTLVNRVIRDNIEELERYPSRIVLPDSVPLVDMKEAAEVSNVSLEQLTAARQPKLPQRQAEIAAGYARFMAALEAKRAYNNRRAEPNPILARVDMSDMTRPPTSTQAAPRLLYAIPGSKAIVRGVERDVHGILFDIKNIPLVALFNEKNEVISYTKLTLTSFKALRESIADPMVPLSKEGDTSVALPMEIRASLLQQLSDLMSQMQVNRENLKEMAAAARKEPGSQKQLGLAFSSDLPATRSGPTQCVDGHFEAQQHMAEIDSALAAQPFKKTRATEKGAAMR